MKTFGLVLLVLAMLGLGIAWEVYEYHQCKHVGYSTFHCVMQIGK